MRTLLALWLIGSAVAYAEPKKPVWGRATVTASSTKASKADQFAAWRAIDNDTDTKWCEGAKGNGVGESITIAFDSPTQLPNLYVASKTVTAVEYSIDGGTPKRMELKKWDDTPLKVAAKKVEVKIVEAKKVSDACLDLSFTFVGVFVGDEKAYAALMPAMTNFIDGMASCDETALAKVGAFPITRDKRLASAKALAQACSKKRVAKISGENWEGGHCGLDVPERVVCIGSGPDSWWRFVWKDAAWKLVSLREKHYAE